MARLVLIAALFAAACDRGQPPAPPTSTTPAPAPAPALAPSPAPAPVAAAAAAPVGNPPGCTLGAFTSRRPAARRVVAIGDLHGDLSAARAALRAAGAIDARDRWTAGDTVIVQTGDVLDRGDDEQEILDLLASLSTQAEAAGGAVVRLLGNHELMNAAGDFRYVTPGAMTEFDDVAGVDGARFAQAPAELRKRLDALAPGGVYAKRLAGLGVVAVVGDTAFAHAGVAGPWGGKIEEINASARCWLDGQAGDLTSPPPAVTAEDGPVWTRAWGRGDVDCAALRQALAAAGVARMVVGHTPQRTINAACDGLVWRIDVGMSKHYGGAIEVLELVTGQPPRVLRGSR